MKSTRAGLVIAASIVLGVALVGAAPPSPAPTKPATPKSPAGKSKPATAAANPSAFVQRLAKAAGAELGKLRTGTTPDEVAKSLDDLFDLAVAYAQIPGDEGALVELASARRLARQCAAARNEDRRAVVALLLDNPHLARTLALGALPEDKPAMGLAVLAALAKHAPEAVKDSAGWAGLIAAICWVYDEPPRHPTLPNPPAGRIDAVGVFDHFRKGAGSLVFSPKDLPARLLTYAVDLHISPAEVEWATTTYPANRMAGKLYGSIVYDTDAYRKGTEKKVFSQPGGYTLMNIKKVGGECGERSYFASEVAKSVGIPSAFVYARASEGGHAYLGYLRRMGEGTSWDFSEGRFDEFQELTGHIRDPQTGGRLSDADLALTAGLAQAKAADRDAAVALTDAAARLEYLRTVEDARAIPFPPAPPSGLSLPGAAPRRAEVAAVLGFAEAAVRACPAHLPAWDAVVAIAKSDALAEGDKKKWAEAAMRVCGRSYPDFVLSVIGPMIRTVSPVQAQSDMWDWAASQFGQRSDLVAAARFEQGRAWERAGDPDRALGIYREVCARYPNEGSSVLIALARAEALADKSGKPGAALAMYEDVFRRLSKPPQSSREVWESTNYSIVGRRYAELLDGAGKKSDAARVRKQIGDGEEENGAKGTR